MNYLAHAWFSFGHPEIITGNLLSDFIKGKKQYEFPEAIQLGIKLHRAIDTFTDNHYAVNQAKQVFRADYRLYAGAFIDVAFDYFVANDTAIFPQKEHLHAFTKHVYDCLRKNNDWIPQEKTVFFERMQTQNWLFHYHSFEGIQKSFAGLVLRSKHLSDSEKAFELMQTHLNTLLDCYRKFAPDLTSFVADYGKSLPQSFLFG